MSFNAGPSLEIVPETVTQTGSVHLHNNLYKKRECYKLIYQAGFCRNNALNLYFGSAWFESPRALARPCQLPSRAFLFHHSSFYRPMQCTLNTETLCTLITLEPGFHIPTYYHITLLVVYSFM